jgi:hypothetical protein
MQTDGNFVIYNKLNKPVWASNTEWNTGAYLNVQPDGNLVVYTKKAYPLWSTKSQNLGNILGPGQNLNTGQWMTTIDGMYTLQMQNGDLQMRDSSWGIVWSSGTLWQPWTQAEMTPKGDFVLRDTNGHTYDISYTSGNPGARFEMLYNPPGQGSPYCTLSIVVDKFGNSIYNVYDWCSD